jgi:hypothetical protein
LSFGRSRSVSSTKNIKDGQKFCTLNVSNGKLKCVEKKREETERFRVGVSADEDQSDKELL